MSLAQRLQRLEIAEQQRAVLIQAERMAEKLGVGVDELLHRAREIGARVERWGLDAEVRRLAKEYSVSEDDVWERYSVLLAGEEEA